MLLSEIWSIIRTDHGNAVLIKPKKLEVAVPIFVGTLELQSILVGHEKVNLSRPLTHDLFLDMLNHVNLSIKRVELHEIKNDVFHARLVVTGGEYTNENPLILDSRPSDAFALVTRKRCPIYISSVVVEQTGIPLDFFINALEDEEPLEQGNITLQTLQRQLEQAIAKEEYELAAEIRDKINIEKTNTNILKITKNDGGASLQ